MANRDNYTPQAAIAAEWLVPESAQPDYLELDALSLEGSANAADWICDRHVRGGRGGEIAAVDAESGRSFTYSELASLSDDMARRLRSQGIRDGDRIGVRSPNTAEALVAMLAVLKMGCVLTPVPLYARRDDLGHLLDDAEPALLLVHASEVAPNEISAAVEGRTVRNVLCFGSCDVEAPFTSVGSLEADGSRPVREGTADTLAILWHTGGTTGKPKGCYHTHRRFILGGIALGRATGADFGQRWSAAAPIGHALGLIHHTIYSVMNGATAVFIPNYSKPDAVLEAIQRYGITTMTGLSSTWAKMLEEINRSGPYDLSSLRQCYAMWQSASASNVYDGWMDQGVQLLNNFGSTAFGTWPLVPRVGQPSPRASLGKPAPGYIIQAVTVEDGNIIPVPEGQIGRMAVKGPTGLTYWKRPEMQARDVLEGWTLCDDLIRFDEEGNAAYCGRTDYMISTAGNKVAPVEVEQVLAEHRLVREVAVVPAPCPTKHEIVAAFVALERGVSGDDALKRELREHVKERLAFYKVPSVVTFVDALPRDAVGKVQTGLVRQWAAAK
ncbi:AMP-binding protein [Amorphus sp. MBR-141]